LKSRAWSADTYDADSMIGRPSRPVETGDNEMRLRVLAGVLMLAASGGCSTWHKAIATTPDRIDRPATGAPDLFLREDGTEITGNTCLTPLMDPRDKSLVQLVRAIPVQGDYRVEGGKYGVRANELLRIDCTTGRTVGIVRE
jgi:hypothetical protein